MKRRLKPKALWELPCPARDAVLWTSFTWGELATLADAAGFHLEGPGPLSPAARRWALMGAIHQSCAEPNPLSRRLQEMLETVHEAATLRLATSATDEVLAWCVGDLGLAPVPLAALVWGVATDPREAMSEARKTLLWRLFLEGLASLAFGKVELIEIPS